MKDAKKINPFQVAVIYDDSRSIPERLGISAERIKELESDIDRAFQKFMKSGPEAGVTEALSWATENSKGVNESVFITYIYTRTMAEVEHMHKQLGGDGLIDILKKMSGEG